MFKNLRLFKIKFISFVYLGTILIPCLGNAQQNPVRVARSMAQVSQLVKDHFKGTKEVIEGLFDMDETLTSYTDYYNSDFYYPLVEAAMKIARSPKTADEIAKMHQDFKKRVATFNADNGCELIPAKILTSTELALNLRDAELAQLENKVTSEIQAAALEKEQKTAQMKGSEMWYYKSNDLREISPIGLVAGVKELLHDLDQDSSLTFRKFVLTSRGEDQRQLSHKQLDDLGIKKHFASHGEDRLLMKNKNTVDKGTTAVQLLKAKGSTHLFFIDNEDRHTDSFKPFMNDPAFNLLVIHLIPPQHVSLPQTQAEWDDVLSAETLFKIIKPKL